MLRAKELQRACPRSQTWLQQVFDTAVAAPVKNEGRSQTFARRRPRASPQSCRRSQLRPFSTSQGAVRQGAQAEARNDAETIEDVETIVRQAKATFGNTLPKGYLTGEEYKLYERLYGTPLRDTRPDDIGIPEKGQHGEVHGNHMLLRDTEDGGYEHVDYAVKATVISTSGEAGKAETTEETAIQIHATKSLADNQLEYINAVARNQREYNALMNLQRDFEAASLLAAMEEAKEQQLAERELETTENGEEPDQYGLQEYELEDEDAATDVEVRGGSAEKRHHPLTIEGWSRTNPSTIQLPKAEFVEPITQLLKRTDVKHLRDAAEKAYGGRGLPWSPASPRGKRNVEQKGMPIEAGHHRMSEIQADVFLAAAMPAIYATATSTLVEVRRRLGSSWIRGLLDKKDGSAPRVLDIGGGGAALAAWNEVFESEKQRLEEEGKLPGPAQPEIGPKRTAENTVVVGSDALRHRTSTFLHNTTFLPRLPDLLHSAENVQRHIDAPETPLPPRKKYDIIIASHTLLPQVKTHQRRAMVANLWALLNPEGGVLIFVEKGHPRGFEAVADAREQILDDLTAATTDETIGPEDPSAKQRGPGMIIAPCTNQGKCPMYLTPGLTSGRKDFCHFSQRFIRAPFIQRMLGVSHKNHEDVDYSYVAVRRGTPSTRTPQSEAEPARTQPIQQNKEATDAAFKGYEKLGGAGTEELPPNSLSLPRTVMPPLKRHGHVILDMCTPAGHLERWTVPRSFSRQAYHDARKSQWGDLWALGAKTRIPRTVRLGRKGDDGKKRPRVINLTMDGMGRIEASEKGRKNKDKSGGKGKGRRGNSGKGESLMEELMRNSEE